MDAPDEIYQLKIRLLGISPMIWRRVLVPASTTLRELHGILQVAMGWEGIHLFVVDIHAVRYGSFELQHNRRLSLIDLKAEVGIVIDTGRHAGEGGIQFVSKASDFHRTVKRSPQRAADDTFGALPFPRLQEARTWVRVSNARSRVHAPVLLSHQIGAEVLPSTRMTASTHPVHKFRGSIA